MPSEYGAAEQLQIELQDSVKRAIATRRPIITHLNADTSWLVQLPRPHHGSELIDRRSYYNILIDPWLSGPQSDVASWFSTQWHAIASSVQTIEELEDQLHEIEEFAQTVHENTSRYQTARHEDSSYIDLVVISHEFTDHCHQATLQEVNPSVPIIATEQAATLVKSWNHFETVLPTLSFHPGTDWRQTSVAPLPQWLGVARIVSPGNKLYYHSAVMITFKRTGSTGNDAAEAVIYSPHGIEAKDLVGVAQADPHIHTLALMHGLHDVGMRPNFQLNLGAHNALKAQRALKPSYWVGTHDEVKKGGGLIAPLLRRSVLTLQEAVEKEAQESGRPGDLQGVNFAELRSGESLLLL